MKIKNRKSIHPAVIVAALLLLAAAAAAGAAYWRANGEREAMAGAHTQQVRAEAEALTALSFAGTPIPYTAADITVTGLDGAPSRVQLAGSGESADVALDGPTGAFVFARTPARAQVAVTFGGEEVFRGTPEEFSRSFRPAQDGVYDFAVSADMENIAARGTVDYRFSVTYTIVPVLWLSRDTAPQGGALVVYGENLREDDAVAVTVPFSFTPHVVRTQNGFYAYIPFNYLREPGAYTLDVVCGGESYALPYTVTATDYTEQHLTVSTETESTTIGDDTALRVYNNTIADLDKIADDAVYWSGAFEWPCTGTVTTEFGAQRYINEATKPSSIHAGVDIACDEGTPVGASNAGRVLYADFLQVSGWTVVIEHGGGLHTMYLHMSALNCAAGDKVAKGDVIGYVGATGFATGPHLHFQASVGGACISPMFLFDGSCGIYDKASSAGQAEA